MRDMNLYWLEDMLKNFGLGDIFSVRKQDAAKPDSMNPDTREKLKTLFMEDVRALEDHMGRKISAWKDFS